MLKKTIKYIDYNDVERTEDFYFNLNETELYEMQLGTAGGYDEYIQRIIAAQDTPTLIAIFKDLVLKTYGQKSLDGKRFIKSDQLREEFSQTEAYNKLFMELATNTDAAIAFVNGVMPANLKEKAKDVLPNT